MNNNPWEFELTPEEKLMKAKIDIQKNNPFYSIPMFKLRMKHMPEMNGKGMLAGVDPNFNLYWTDDLAKLHHEQIKTVLKHECLHIMLMHLIRKGMRNHQIFNIANDIAINDILVQEHCDFPPDSELVPDYNHELTVKKLDITVREVNKKCSEQIYDEIYPALKNKFKQSIAMTKSEFEKLGKEGKISMSDDGGWDVHIIDDSPPEEQKKIEENIKKTLAESIAYAKQQGKLPAGLERLAGDILKTRIPWKQVLYRYITNTIPFNFTWQKPNKRLIGMDVYLPAVSKEEIEICAAVDTSGSIGEKELNEFVSEMISITRSFANIKLHVIVADSAVHNVYTLNHATPKEIKELKMRGGGGTSHRPVLERIKKDFPNTKLLVAFTDGYSDINSLKQPPYQVLWVLSDNSCSKESIKWGNVMKCNW